MPPPPPPPPSPPVEKIIVNVNVPPETNSAKSPVTASTPPVTSYSVASLQQYTNSFREENLIKDGRLGKVYMGERPDGKLLSVLKLDDVNSKISVDEFLELVLSISELRHPSILELVGYCAEHGQRLLVYNYFSKKTLSDVLHGDDEMKGKLSWNARLQVALAAAKALQYLHEFQPPIVHQDFEPGNILVNIDLAIRVTDCGLASLMLSDSVAQLSGRMRALLNYEAPEVHESGMYSDRSDVYSFGVVMLELLSGRQPHDRLFPSD
ncbi:Protein strubbelig-receptor family 3 [Apostasia shenzhenica]|uniref:non-specific serine/threonine protein kinase n=1 Tax=Apostasia shenzhenica TaxID=1088818 RepID=A0A2H9ZX65_9ASPA|nr:Protein strubbelig-receptor family 3 [Apostasia shenzhenica]